MKKKKNDVDSAKRLWDAGHCYSTTKKNENLNESRSPTTASKE